MFSEILTRLAADSEDVQGVLLMDFEGIPIESIQSPDWPHDFDITTVGMEVSVALKGLAKAFSILEGTPCDTVELQGHEFSLSLRMLTETYFLMAVMSPTALRGRANYRLRMAAPALLAALA